MNKSRILMENRHIEAFVREILHLNRESALAIVLVGSAARGTQTSKSDIDLLLVGESKPQLPKSTGNFHVHYSSPSDFLAKLREGDDLCAWCVRHGIEIEDPGLWAEIQASDEAAAWPNWRKKMLHATRRLTSAKILLDTGDADAAAEEALYAASHVARAVLLRANVFPLSRSELVKQADDLGYRRLAEIIADLLEDRHSHNSVRQVLQYLKKLLCTLDTAEYGRLATEFADRRPLKKP